MVRRECFVPGCRTGSAKNRLQNKKEGKKTPALFGPRSVEQLKQWRKYIPRADRDLTMNDRVCELHFLEEDVIKYFETEITDGTLFRLERGRYTLVQDAVPLIYPCLPNYLSKIAEKRRKMKQKCSIDHDLKRNQRIKNSFNSMKNVAVNVEEPLETLSIDRNLNSNQKTNSFDSVENFEPYVHETPKTFTYAELTENIDCIVRPNILWGITCHELFVMCALWNAEGELQLKMIIDKNLDVKICMKGETSVLKHGLTCIEDISALLSKINGDIITDSTS
ncbi:uncharacterized protein LOC129229468 [Uloborus diversus]|uniref:uncharacterized protein LOC129229468 n=1 Tax=Uloborus diversus TaxID=327109 RepID=UPI0024098009|nr:uncharacterized protein LOC129229468 [Uloborus diversus]